MMGFDLNTSDLGIVEKAMREQWPIPADAKAELMKAVGVALANIDATKERGVRRLTRLIEVCVAAERNNLARIESAYREERVRRGEQHAASDVFSVVISELPGSNRKPPHEGGGDGGDGLTRHKG